MAGAAVLGVVGVSGCLVVPFVSVIDCRGITYEEIQAQPRALQPIDLRYGSTGARGINGSVAGGHCEAPDEVSD